jgi:hypothetical protein
MSFTNSTTYCGKDALEFFSTALLEGDVKSRIKAFTNVKSKIKVPSFDISNILQAASCTFNDQQTSVLDDKTLETCAFKVNVEICRSVFENSFLADQLRAGSNNGDVPASFEEYLISQMAKSISTDLEDLLWNGDSEDGDLCNGFITTWTGDTAVVDVSGTTLTSNNILAEVGKVYVAIPSTIRTKTDTVIFVSPYAAALYKQAIAAGTGNGGAYFTNTNVPLNYLGVELVVATGLANDTMAGAQLSNLWMGTDLVSDLDEVKLINMQETTGADAVRFVTNFKFGVNYGVGAEIVLYK